VYIHKLHIWVFRNVFVYVMRNRKIYNQSFPAIWEMVFVDDGMRRTCSYNKDICHFKFRIQIFNSNMRNFVFLGNFFGFIQRPVHHLNIRFENMFYQILYGILSYLTSTQQQDVLISELFLMI